MSQPLDSLITPGTPTPVEPHWANLKLGYLQYLQARYAEMSGKEPNLLLLGHREIAELRRSCGPIISGTQTALADWRLCGLHIVPISRSPTGLMLAHGIHANILAAQNK